MMDKKYLLHLLEGNIKDQKLKLSYIESGIECLEEDIMELRSQEVEEEIYLERLEYLYERIEELDSNTIDDNKLVDDLLISLGESCKRCNSKKKAYIREGKLINEEQIYIKEPINIDSIYEALNMEEEEEEW